MKFFLVMFICSSISKTCGPPMDYDYQFEDWSSCIKRGGELIVEFVDQIDYCFDESLKDKFVASISRYWPDINPNKLHPDYTGIRPKITKPNESMRDFSIQTSDHHGIKNFINLQGIESPGLTSSLAIGKLVKNLLEQGH